MREKYVFIILLVTVLFVSSSLVIYTEKTLGGHNKQVKVITRVGGNHPESIKDNVKTYNDPVFGEYKVVEQPTRGQVGSLTYNSFSISLSQFTLTDDEVIDFALDESGFYVTLYHGDKNTLYFFRVDPQTHQITWTKGITNIGTVYGIVSTYYKGYYSVFVKTTDGMDYMFLFNASNGNVIKALKYNRDRTDIPSLNRDEGKYYFSNGEVDVLFNNYIIYGNDHNIIVKLDNGNYLVVDKVTNGLYGGTDFNISIVKPDGTIVKNYILGSTNNDDFAHSYTINNGVNRLYRDRTGFSNYMSKDLSPVKYDNMVVIPLFSSETSLQTKVAIDLLFINSTTGLPISFKTLTMGGRCSYVTVTFSPLIVYNKLIVKSEYICPNTPYDTWDTFKFEYFKIDKNLNIISGSKKMSVEFLAPNFGLTDDNKFTYLYLYSSATLYFN